MDMLFSRNTIELDLKEPLKRKKRKGESSNSQSFFLNAKYEMVVSFYHKFYIGFFKED